VISRREFHGDCRIQAARTYKWIVAGVVLILVCLIVFQSVSRSKQAQKRALDPGAIYVFGEGDRFRRYYICQGNLVFAQSSENPGFGEVRDRKWYYPKKVPDQVLESMKQWAERPSNGPESYVPDSGPLFWLRIIKPGRNEEIDFADFSSDKEAPAFFYSLRSNLIADEYVTNVLPDWLKQSEEVRAHLIGPLLCQPVRSTRRP
jgi:hypothetical protein